MNFIVIDLESEHIPIIIDALEWIRKKSFNKISVNELRTLHRNATYNLNLINSGCNQITFNGMNTIFIALHNQYFAINADPDNFELSYGGLSITSREYMNRVHNAIRWIESRFLESGFDYAKMYF